MNMSVHIIHADSFGLFLSLVRVCFCKRRSYRIVTFIFRSCSDMLQQESSGSRERPAPLRGFGGRAPIKGFGDGVPMGEALKGLTFWVI